MRYQLYREQQLSCDIDTAWQFFASPENLAAITPPQMGFTVRSAAPDGPIQAGTIIRYTVSPLFGIPLRWTTRITQVDPYVSFTDFQEKGPYRYWNHFHEFIPNERGVLIRDRVDYELPFGWLGRLVRNLLVRRKLTEIFDYRRAALANRFNLPRQ